VLGLRTEGLLGESGAMEEAYKLEYTYVFDIAVCEQLLVGSMK
jgi:hypothetical protein